MNSVTAIVNGYRRPNNLPIQVEALRNQTNPPDEIWLWMNYHEDFDKEKQYKLEALGVDKICYNDHNWKYFGRLALAMLAQTNFVAIFDDDTIPGSKWLENCYASYNNENAVLGGVGLHLHSDTVYMHHTRFGLPNPNEEPVVVDLVGHAWFINTDHLKYIWSEKPYTWETGEDIHFSALAQIYGNIKTIVPPHPIGDREMHSSLLGYELGVDNKTVSVTEQGSFFSLRDGCVQHYVSRGWKLVDV